MVKQIVRNLNKVIDVNYYPIPQTKRSNSRHRPIGLGVQGLADVFAMLKIGFDSEEAREVNRRIFETIYYYSLETSMEISKKREKPMKKYKELCSKLLSADNESDRQELIKEKN